MIANLVGLNSLCEFSSKLLNFFNISNIALHNILLNNISFNNSNIIKSNDNDKILSIDLIEIYNCNFTNNSDIFISNSPLILINNLYYDNVKIF